MTQPAPNFIVEDGTIREFTDEDMTRITDAMERVRARLEATGQMFFTSNADEAP